MKMRRQASGGSYQIHEIFGNVLRLDGTEPQHLDWGFVQNPANKTCQVNTRDEIASIATQVDSAQNDLLHAGICQFTNLRNRLVYRQAATSPANKWNHAVGATIVAAILHFQNRSGAVPGHKCGRSKSRRCQREHVACKYLRSSRGRDISSKRVNWNEIGDATAFPCSACCQLARQGGYCRLVRISNYACDSRNRSEFSRRALRIAPGDDDARSRIRGVNFPHGFPRLRIRRRRNGAGVQHNDAGGLVVRRQREPGTQQLVADSSCVGVRSAAAKVFNGECGHVVRAWRYSEGNYNSDSIPSTNPGNAGRTTSAAVAPPQRYDADSRGGSSPHG